MKTSTVLFSALLMAVALSWTDLAKAEEPGYVIATGASQPQMAIDRDGVIYVVFIHNGNISVSKSADRGKSFGPPVIAIDAGGKARGGMHRGPRIGVDAKKQLTVTCPIVLDEKERLKKYPTAELVAVRSQDGGQTWTRPLQVNEVSKQAPEALHWMTVAPDGEVHIAWLDLRGRTEPGEDLYYAKLVDGKIGKNQKIASLVCECCAPGLAVDAAGNPIVAFREGGAKPSREIFAVHSTDRGEHFGPPQQINRSPTKEKGCPMSAPAVAVSADGKQFAVAWKDMRTGQPQIQWSKAETPAFTSDAPIHKLGQARQDHPSLAVDAQGIIWMAWEEKVGGNQQIWIRSSNTDDQARIVSDNNEGQLSFPVIACHTGFVGVVYESRKEGKATVRFRLLKSQ